MSLKINALNKLHIHLKDLNADTGNMITGYFPDTGIKIGLIRELLKIRKQLESESNPELNNKFEKIKAELITYIQTKTNGENNDAVNDLLFEIRTVSENELEVVTPSVITDIQQSTLSDVDKNNLVKSLGQKDYKKTLEIVDALKKK